MNLYNYFLILLVSCILIYVGFILCLKYCPPKIKMIYSVILILFGVKICSLFILLILGNINYVYILKYTVFMNLICMPICAVVSICIFGRYSKINYSYILGVIAVSVLMYGFTVFKYTANIELSITYGYFINYKEPFYVYLPYLIINVLLIMMAINNFLKKYAYRNGIMFLIFSLIMNLASIIAYVIGKNFIPLQCISDMILILVINYSMYSLKK